ncbi:MAG: uracil phosphoribosyltransferase [Ignavibacteriaceae bacterium]|nr:uracil phosphoribosyltransferase [Ignavibacteriaceae bacterium]
MKKSFKNFNLIDHPLVERNISILRDVNTNCETFRSAISRLSNLIAVKLFADLKLTEIEVETPLEKTKGYKLAQEVVIVPVLRAGLGMVNGFLQVIPDAKVGHIGLERDEETLKPIEYYYKTPDNLIEHEIVLVDPMLATGGSASAAISFLKKRGAKNIIFACLVAAPEGINKINEDHPDVKIFGAALDRELNDKGYILPGLGDAGDRTFGTL